MYFPDYRFFSSRGGESGILLGNRLLGVVGTVAALLVSNGLWSSLLGVFAFSSFWTIKEIFEQEERVRKGWFPANPKKIKKSS